METLLQWTATRLRRRDLLNRAAVGVFGIATGLTVGVPRGLAANPCAGPFQTGACPSGTCNGRHCHGDSFWACQDVSSTYCWGGCPSPATCWNGPAVGTCCCDCKCFSPGGTLYCYCYG
jgi:hypothetical protein